MCLSPRLAPAAFLALVALLALPFGTSAWAQSAQLIRTHSSPGNREFGFDVAGVGDLDGDGRPDYAVGAPDLGKFGLDGAAHAFSGATGTLLRNFLPPSAGREARFGAAVVGVGDLSGDGVPDLLIGEPDQDGVFQEQGRAYIYNGATSAVIRTFIPPTSATSGDFGAAVADAGDVSGDGVTDLLIGAPDANGFVGQAFLYNGATGVLLRTFNTPTPRNGGGFGFVVLGVEDANGDGVRDVLVGAPSEGETVFAGFGFVHLFSGASGTLIRTIESPEPSDTGRFGYAIDLGADVTGDGRREVLIGEPNGGPGQPGKVYLHDLATNTFPRTFEPPSSGSGEAVGTFGEAVASIGDITSDGVPDVLIGDPKFADTDFTPDLIPGRAHLYDGATGDELFNFRSPQERHFGGFGSALAAVGDVDADGDVDFVVGAPGEDSGRAHVYGVVPGVVVVPAGLFSEYVEGTSFNRAVEIYNDGDVPLNLAAGGYALELYLNGASTPGATIALTGTVAPGGVHVVADERADAAVLAVADQTTTSLLFSGNDAVVLVSGDEVVDALGQIGFDPGVEWGSGLASTADNTLRREGASCLPDTDPDNAFNPAQIYTGYPTDTFGGLGNANGLNCGAPPIITVVAAPVNPPVVIPAGGGSFQFAVTLTNTTDQPQTFEAWTAVEGPAERSPVLGPRTVTLAPGATVTRTLTQQVPAAAPAGTYTYIVNVGDFPGTVTTSDDFTVVKEGALVAGSGAASEPVAWAVSGWDEAATASSTAAPPRGLALGEVWPNPVAAAARLTLDVGDGHAVRVGVYDALGRRVALLHDGALGRGVHTLMFNSIGLPSGVYVVRASGERSPSATRRLVVAR